MKVIASGSPNMDMTLDVPQRKIEKTGLALYCLQESILFIVRAAWFYYVLFIQDIRVYLHYYAVIILSCKFIISVFVHFLVSQMTFASDKLYNGYLRRNMPTIVSKVKVREIIPYLPCLTDHDRVGFIWYKDLELGLGIA